MLLCTVAIGFVSCQSENQDLNLTKTNYTLYSDATTKIEGSDLSNTVWDSDNEFVAVAEGDVLTSKLVGSTTIKSGNSNIFVTVKPRYTLYKEPEMLWGCTKKQIIAKCGTPTSTSGDTVIYETGNYAAPYELYLFENDRLTSCGVLVQLSYSSNLIDFIGERYVIIAVEGATATFVHCYGKISDPKFDYGGQLAYQSSLGGLLVGYVANSSNSSSSEVSVDLEQSRGAVQTKVFDIATKALLKSGITIK